MKEVWDKIKTSASIVRFVIVCAFIMVVGVLILRMFNVISDFINPELVIKTEYIYEPIDIHAPDGNIGFFEKLKKKEVPPTKVYDTVRYISKEPVNHLIMAIDSDGKHITVLTQLCGTPMGKRIVFGYHERFELVTTGNDKEPVKLNRYIDYWDWEKLWFGVSNGPGVVAETRLRFLPFNLEGSLTASYNKINIFSGEKFGGKIEAKLMWRVF